MVLALEYFSQAELYDAVVKRNVDIVEKLLSEVGLILNHILTNFTILSYRIGLQPHVYTTACLEGQETTISVYAMDMY